MYTRGLLAVDLVQSAYGLDLSFPTPPPVLNFKPRILDTTAASKVSQLDDLVRNLNTQPTAKRVQSLLVAKFDSVCKAATATQQEISETGITYPWALFSNGIIGSSQSQQ